MKSSKGIAIKRAAFATLTISGLACMSWAGSMTDKTMNPSKAKSYDSNYVSSRDTVSRDTMGGMNQENQRDSKHSADNSGVNKRDRGDSTLTPMDQGNSSMDIKTTQAIRKTLMDDKTLSVKAKNVKIITNNGMVTLRGVVESSAEKSRIQTAAKKIAGTASVRDQLEVASK